MSEMLNNFSRNDVLNGEQVEAKWRRMLKLSFIVSSKSLVNLDACNSLVEMDFTFTYAEKIVMENHNGKMQKCIREYFAIDELHV